MTEHFTACSAVFLAMLTSLSRLTADEVPTVQANPSIQQEPIAQTDSDFTYETGNDGKSIYVKITNKTKRPIGDFHVVSQYFSETGHLLKTSTGYLMKVVPPSGSRVLVCGPAQVPQSRKVLVTITEGRFVDGGEEFWKRNKNDVKYVTPTPAPSVTPSAEIEKAYQRWLGERLSHPALKPGTGLTAIFTIVQDTLAAFSESAYEEIKRNTETDSTAAFHPVESTKACLLRKGTKVVVIKSWSAAGPLEIQVQGETRHLFVPPDAVSEEGVDPAGG